MPKNEMFIGGLTTSIKKYAIYFFLFFLSHNQCLFYLHVELVELKNGAINKVGCFTVKRKYNPSQQVTPQRNPQICICQLKISLVHLQQLLMNAR